MRILFITSTRLGDAVLSTGALDHFIGLYPDAEVTVACGPLVAGLFAPVPQVRRVIALRKEPYAGHWIRLARQTFGKRWNIVVDLRNSLLSRLLLADKKYIWGRQEQNQHKVEQIGALIGVSPPPAPRLWFDRQVLAEAERLVPSGSTKVLAVGPSANWQGKTWPAQNFSSLIGKITDRKAGFLPEARIAVIAAPGEEQQARPVLESVPADRRIDLIAKTSPLLAAACLRRSALYIGNDSGLMHCAAAVGTPTLGLFGPSWPQLYRPWGDHAAYVSTPEDYKQLTSYPGYHPDTAPCLMGSLTVEAAFAAASELWNRTGNGPDDHSFIPA